MKVWKQLSQLFTSKKQAPTAEAAGPQDYENIDYGDRVRSPNSLFGLTGNRKSVNPHDPTSSGSIYNANKKDRF